MRLQGDKPVAFALVFATRKSKVDSVAGALAKAARGDSIVWFAYPKGSSKRYTCDFNRDTGWGSLGKCGFEGVPESYFGGATGTQPGAT
jgi:hypothetical protein